MNCYIVCEIYYSIMISFIICTYNREKYIYECLSRLAKNTAQASWEIVLVNNNSTDRTAEECQRFEADYPEVHYSYYVETQQGLSFARNRGIAEAHGDWFVFLDDDAMVEPDYVENLQKNLKEHPETKAFGGPIDPFFEGEAPAWLSPWTMIFVSAINMGKTVKPFPKNRYPIGANMGVCREAIECVGAFDPSLGRVGNNLMGGEEKDLFNRIRQAGIEILYFPDIKVRHCIPPKRTTKEFIAKLGSGVGQSEKLRTQRIGTFAYMNRLLSECIKWCGTIIIWLYYAIQGHRSKGDILVIFRHNVTKGLL